MTLTNIYFQINTKENISCVCGIDKKIDSFFGKAKKNALVPFRKKTTLNNT